MDDKTRKVFYRLPVTLGAEEVACRQQELESILGQLSAPPVEGLEPEEEQKAKRALRRQVIGLKWQLHKGIHYADVACIEETDPVTEEVIVTRQDTMEVVPPVRREVPMEKYGVKTENELTKKGSPYGNNSCPLCGSELAATNPPVCPKCGSEPLEDGHVEEEAD